jgi:DNA-directed RNA polymerase specialized sigma24 family protein
MPLPTPFDSVIDQFRPERATGWGSITLLIRNAGTGESEHKEELWTAVLVTLRETATRVLATFPNSSIENPDELISGVYEKLQARMGNEEISDRHHFFATACTHFRWAMLDELKKRRVDVMPDVPDIVEMPDEDIAAEREMQQLVMAELGSLDESLQRIVCGRLFLGMTFEELGREYDMPLTTAYDKFNSGIELLRRRVSQA